MASSQSKNTTKPFEITEDAIKLNDSDLISPLPKDLLQHILTLLPVEDAVPLSCVSKTWLNAWNNLPVLEYRFDNEEDVSLKELVKRVDDSLLNPRILMTIIESFSLKMNVARDDGLDLVLHLDLAFYLYDWVSLIMRNYVKELSIRVLNNSNPPARPYLLPESVFASRFLVKLHLQGCEFPPFDDKKIGFGFNSLKEISLVNVFADENQIPKLINLSRKFLEKLTLKRCPSAYVLLLHDFLMLSYVEVQVKELEIRKTPNLHTLVLCGLWRVTAYDCVNIRTLRCLAWDFDAFNWYIKALISELPLLETLQLYMLRSEKIKIRSRQLRTLLLFEDKMCEGQDPMEVELDTPQLSTLYFSGSSMPLVTMVNNINPNRKLQLHEIGKFSKKFIHPTVDSYLRSILITENMLSLEELKEYPVLSHAPKVRMLIQERNPASSDTSFLNAFF